MSTLRSIERFLKKTGMAPTAFGRQALRDPRLVFDIRNGREPTNRTKRRIEHFMSLYEGSAAR
jgi:2,4-dienoyl-CoA reductase-like NADH-dependent reductase (Old Yellow Enzyme family)